jgi:hypothetical protein
MSTFQPEAAAPFAPRYKTCEAAFAGAIFLSAALLFCVQPMFSKMVLPILGGSAAVWSIAMVVYQGLLLCGYLYAHALTTWVRPRYAAVVHVGLMIVAFCTLPIGVAAGFGEPPAEYTALWLIALFVASIGLPFMALSANSPLLQAWFVRSGHPNAENPYMLYRASNIGSFASLLAYPLVIEPMLSAKTQAHAWSAAFVILIAGIVACATFLKPAAVEIARAEPETAVSWRERLTWMGLSFIPSGLLVAVTAHISTDVASAPLLWVIPLALYLLTFVFAFADRPIVSERVLLIAQALSLPILGILFLISSFTHWALALCGHLAGFFIAAMVCHTLLYKRRPAAGHVTQFYVWLSFGGVLGGAFAALLAPVIFVTSLEYPLLLVAALFVRPDILELKRREWSEGAIFSLVLAVALIVPYVLLDAAMRTGYYVVAAMVVLATMLLFTRRLARLAFLTPALFLLVCLYTPDQGTVYRARSFYGVHRVVDIEQGRFRLLYHGTTAHGGEQLLADDGSKIEGRPNPLTYYYHGGPYSAAIDAVRARAGGYLPRVGLIGLGAGIFTCHRHEGESWDLYELDPLVIGLAKDETLFRAVTKCAPDAAIIAGDARLTVQKAKPGYDFLVLDAFTSDAVPVHLLTREALTLYKEKLAPNGVIAFNISNRNLELASVIAGSAAASNLVTIVKNDPAKLDVQKTLKFNAEIALVARTHDDFGILNGDPSWRRVDPTPGQRVWTDDYASIASALVRKLAARAHRSLAPAS